MSSTPQRRPAAPQTIIHSLVALNFMSPTGEVQEGQISLSEAARAARYTAYLGLASQPLDTVRCLIRQGLTSPVEVLGMIVRLVGVREGAFRIVIEEAAR